MKLQLNSNWSNSTYFLQRPPSLEGGGGSGVELGAERRLGVPANPSRRIHPKSASWRSDRSSFGQALSVRQSRRHSRTFGSPHDYWLPGEVVQ